MRKMTGGDGSDTSAAAMAWLAAHKQVWQAELYLIGEADDPAALWLTNWESPLLWSPFGTFLSTVITRGTVTSKIGLEAESLELTWTPRNQTVTASIATASPYQLAAMGGFDHKRVRVWRTIMPTPGDANTFGTYELYGGFVGKAQPERGRIVLNVDSYLYVLDQKVPSGIIEVTNTLASYMGGAPPRGFTVMPQFSVFTGSTPTLLLCDQVTPTAGNIPSGGSLDDGFVVFNGGPGATLQGQYSIVGNNGSYTDGASNKHTSISLLSPLPWAPTPGVDTFYVSGANPVNQADGDYYGFPYVPSPQTAA